MENYDIQQCVDRGLATFGSESAQKLYWIMLSKFNMRSDDIISKPAEFAKALYEVFGESGGRSIERAIIKEIKVTFGLPLNDCRDLVNAIYNARKQLAAVEFVQ